VDGATNRSGATYVCHTCPPSLGHAALGTLVKRYSSEQLRPFIPAHMNDWLTNGRRAKADEPLINMAA